MDYFLFALRNLKRKGVRSWLTLLGICIGIATIVSLISLGNGLKLAVNSQFGVSSTELITITAGGIGFSAPGSSVTKPLTQSDLEAIRRIGLVDYALPRNIETIQLEFNNKLKFTSATSIPKDYEKELYSVAELKTVSGRLLKRGDTNKVVLGSSLADSSKNGLEKDILVGKKVTINGKEFVVEGILKKKGSFIVDGILFMYEDELKSLTSNEDKIDIIAVKVKDKNSIDKTKTEIEKLLRKRRNVKEGNEDFKVSTPQNSLNQINQIINGIQIFIVIIASVSIVIGALGIINTMTTSVLERRKEIGIMKSIGAKNSQVFLQFFVESGFLGFVGGAIGVIFGIIIGFIGTTSINSFIGSTSSPQVNFYLIFFSLLGSFSIGALAGIFPAMKAAKQNPVIALKS